MKQRMLRRLALEALRAPDRKSAALPHQQDKVDELFQRSEQELALAIQQTYRHVFFPSRENRVEGAGIDLAHLAIDVTAASDKPGQGQRQVLRALADNQKLRQPDDHPLAPSYVRDRTPLKKGSISTADLRAEFRKDPRLPILIGDDNFFKLLSEGHRRGSLRVPERRSGGRQGRPALHLQDRSAVVRAHDRLRREARHLAAEAEPGPAHRPVAPGHCRSTGSP